MPREQKELPQLNYEDGGRGVELPLQSDWELRYAETFFFFWFFLREQKELPQLKLLFPRAGEGGLSSQGL